MEKKQMGLTRHATAMDLMIEFPGDRVVPRQRFGPIPQFLMSAASEEDAETFVTHREVMENLQHVKQDRDRHRVQHNGQQRANHLGQYN